MAQAPTKTVQRSTGTAVQPLEHGGLLDILAKKMPTVGKLLPRDIEMDQFRAATWIHIQELWNMGKDKGLQTCFPDTIMTCIVKAATYGMLPGRDCHFLPFFDKRRNGNVSTYVPNYFGIIRGLERSGKVAKAFAHPVYAGDTFVVDYLSDTFSHIPAAVRGREQGGLKMFYGCILMKDGTRHLEVIPLDEMLKIKQRAPGHENGPWVTDFVMMGKKTAIKRVSKPVQLTQETRQMIEEDDQRELTDVSQRRFENTKGELWGIRDTTEETVLLGPGEMIEMETGVEGIEESSRQRLQGFVEQAQRLVNQANKALKNPADTLAPHIVDLEREIAKAVQRLQDPDDRPAAQTAMDVQSNTIADLLQAGQVGVAGGQ